MWWVIHSMFFFRLGCGDASRLHERGVWGRFASPPINLRLYVRGVFEHGVFSIERFDL